jgi:hypothetical protein
MSFPSIDSPYRISSASTITIAYLSAARNSTRHEVHAREIHAYEARL